MKRILVLFIIILLQACSADNESLKQPTGLNFAVDIKREVTKEGNLSFSSGFLVLSRLTFDGDRVQGGDNYFDRRYEDGLVVPFDAGSFIYDLNFDIPQGTYSRIEVEIEIEDDADDDVSIELRGQYTNSDGDDIPLLLQIEKLEIFSANAKDDQGNSEIVLLSSVNSIGLFELKPAHWFSEISREELNDADLEDINGVPTLVINEDHNTDLLDEIEDHLDELVELVIR